MLCELCRHFWCVFSHSLFALQVQHHFGDYASHDHTELEESQRVGYRFDWFANHAQLTLIDHQNLFKTIPTFSREGIGSNWDQQRRFVESQKSQEVHQPGLCSSVTETATRKSRAAKTMEDLLPHSCKL